MCTRLLLHGIELKSTDLLYNCYYFVVYTITYTGASRVNTPGLRDNTSTQYSLSMEVQTKVPKVRNLTLTSGGSIDVKGYPINAHCTEMQPLMYFSINGPRILTPQNYASDCKAKIYAPIWKADVGISQEEMEFCATCDHYK